MSDTTDALPVVPTPSSPTTYIGTVYEVRINEMHPYPIFTSEQVAYRIAQDYGLGEKSIVQREMALFAHIDDFDKCRATAVVQNALNKLTEVEQEALKAHFAK